MSALLPSPPPRLSVVVPVRDEALNIFPLVAEIRAALAGAAFEIVYVDDGSTDTTRDRLAEAQASGAPLIPPLIYRRHDVSCGQSAAVITGVRAASGTWIATLDGDGQNDPADIPTMFARAETEDAAGGGPILIAGHRTVRRDGLTKSIASRIANALRARLLRDATPDSGCGLKVFRRADFLELPHFDHMHRFLPALFIRAGGRVVSIPVNHRPRAGGKSKYGIWDRLWVGIFDLIGVAWLQRRWHRPKPDEELGKEQ